MQGKNLFALAFENDKQGYELRNPFYKGCAIAKAPTTVMGTDSEAHRSQIEHSYVGYLPDTGHLPDGLSESGSVNIFEGVFDFLSALTYYKTDRFRNDSIILNSLWLFDSPYQNQLVEKYGSFNLFLDNDRAGWKKAIEFRNRIKQVHGAKTSVVNRSSLYKPFKDFNQYLTNRRQHMWKTE